MQVSSLGQEDPLEEGMATHTSILVWEIPRTEKPGGLQWDRKELDTNGNPLQCSCLENPRDRGAWGAAVYGVA